LKAIVVFLGAHYMTYVKQIINGEPKWKCYDDVSIRFYNNWSDVIVDIIDAGVLPTNIIYEKSS
jgi:hypothetical protein